MSPFIVLDGPDGSGKTTQVLRLADALRSHGRQVLITAEPSKGPIGLYLRRHLDPETPPEVLACLFAGDRREHLELEVEPALAHGLDVICDRYIPSSLAYQGKIAEGLNHHFRRPDLTVLLKLSPSAASARLSARGGADAWERERQATAHAGYARAAETLRGWGWNVVEVDAEGSAAEVEARIWSAVKEALLWLAVDVQRDRDAERQEGPYSASMALHDSEDGGALHGEPGRQRAGWCRRRRGGR